MILKIDWLLSSRNLNLFDDKRSDNISNGKVYASRHVGRYDIESAMEAINDQIYFVMGDPEETYRNLEGFFLDKISGRICMDTGYNMSNVFKKYKKRSNFNITWIRTLWSYDFNELVHNSENIIKRNLDELNK